MTSWPQGHLTWLSQAALTLLENARPIIGIVKSEFPQHSLGGGSLVTDPRQDEAGEVGQRLDRDSHFSSGLPLEFSLCRENFPF